MAAWKNTDEIVAEFGLTASSSDLDALSRELADKRNALHPDTTGGNFQSDQQKDNYLRIQDALDYIQRAKDTAIAVLPVTQITQITEILAKTLIDAKKSESTSAEAITHLKETYSRDVSLTLRIPRITSAGTAVVASAIFGFWGNITDNPVLSSLSSFTLVRIIWIYLALLSGAIFLATYLYEQYAQAYLDLLISEDGLFLISEMLVTSYAKDASHIDEEGNLRFSRRELVHLVKRPPRFARSGGFARIFSGLSDNIASQCVDLVLTKLEKRGIKRSDEIDIDEWYLLPPRVVANSGYRNIRTIRTSPLGNILTLFSVVILLLTVFILIGLFMNMEGLSSYLENTGATSIPASTEASSPVASQSPIVTSELTPESTDMSNSITPTSSP